jgi:hypothetical protein
LALKPLVIGGARCFGRRFVKSALAGVNELAFRIAGAAAPRRSPSSTDARRIATFADGYAGLCNLRRRRAYRSRTASRARERAAGCGDKTQKLILLRF